MRGPDTHFQDFADFLLSENVDFDDAQQIFADIKMYVSIFASSDDVRYVNTEFKDLGLKPPSVHKLFMIFKDLLLQD